MRQWADHISFKFNRRNKAKKTYLIENEIKKEENS